MTPLTLPVFTVAIALVAVCSVTSLHAAEPFSEADKAFVAKVSQGGMYEVELAKVAESKATTQDLKDQANTESHDHLLVGAKLKSIMEQNGMEFPKELNSEFKARLARISALPTEKFDAAYIDDMKAIHQADGAAFAKEAAGGSNADLKAFAAETHRIVLRHLGELGAKMD